VGKTRVATALLRAIVARQRRAVGMKPVLTGLDAYGDDATLLREAGNVAAPRALANPYAFTPAIAPHIAAREAAIEIALEPIVAAYRALCEVSDAVVVEGAGGVLVPLNARDDMLDIPARLQLPVVLVVGVRLGCINHALLSALAIAARGLVLAGWVANRIDPAMQEADASIATLKRCIAAPLLARLEWGASELPPLGDVWHTTGLV